jgi:hypothetical protein
VTESSAAESFSEAKQHDSESPKRELVARHIYKVSSSESRAFPPCILLRSHYAKALPISKYSRTFVGYDALAFHVEKTVNGHSLLIAFPKVDNVTALANDLKSHPLHIDGRHYNEVETFPRTKLTFDPHVQNWVARGATHRITIRLENKKMEDTIVGYNLFLRLPLIAIGVLLVHRTLKAPAGMGR